MSTWHIDFSLFVEVLGKLDAGGSLELVDRHTKSWEWSEMYKL